MDVVHVVRKTRGGWRQRLPKELLSIGFGSWCVGSHAYSNHPMRRADLARIPAWHPLSIFGGTLLGVVQGGHSLNRLKINSTVTLSTFPVAIWTLSFPWHTNRTTHVPLKSASNIQRRRLRIREMPIQKPRGMSVGAVQPLGSAARMFVTHPSTVRREAANRGAGTLIIPTSKFKSPRLSGEAYNEGGSALISCACIR
jgi:hypothetical protein